MATVTSKGEGKERMPLAIQKEEGGENNGQPPCFHSILWLPTKRKEKLRREGREKGKKKSKRRALLYREAITSGMDNEERETSREENNNIIILISKMCYINFGQKQLLESIKI